MTIQKSKRNIRYMLTFVVIVNVSELTLLGTGGYYIDFDYMDWIVSVDWILVNFLLFMIYAFVIVSLIGALNNI